MRSSSVAETELPPGPRAPRIVQAMRCAWDQPRFFAECRTRYGPTWTLRLPGFPPGVVTTDREAIRRLFTGDPLTKRHGNDLLRPVVGDRSVLVLEPEEHLERRRLELPPLHGKVIRGYTQKIRSLIETEVASWPCEGIVEAHRRARILTLQTITELVLGVRDRAVAAELERMFDSLSTPITNLGLFLPEQLGRRARWNVVSAFFYRRLDRLHAVLEEHIARTRRDPTLDEREDVLALFVRGGTGGGGALSNADLRDELFTLAIAGHETTAAGISWACDLLAHNPGVVTRLRETLAAGDHTYLEATGKEVLRARTVANISAARYPLETIQVGEWEIGPPVSVLVDTQGLHLDPQLYPAPDEFRPKRFLDGQPDAYSYIPFGGGAHRCPGAALGTLELELALEAIVTRFDLIPARRPAGTVRRGVTLAPDKHGRVLVRRRNGRP